MQILADVDTRWRAKKATRWGMYAALGCSIWFALQLWPLMASVISGAVEPAILFPGISVVAFALWVAWRFRGQKGWISAAILIFLVLLEVVMRIWQTVNGQLSIGAGVAVIILFIIQGLVNGIRGVRAHSALPFDEDELEETFA